jgi:hypothetical protein
MIEPARIAQRGIECGFAGMAERRMAEIMSEAQSLGQVLIETQGTRHSAADLRDFEAVSQPDPEVIAVGSDEHLRLVTQAPKADRVDDAVTVALKDVARSARPIVGLEVKAAARR